MNRRELTAAGMFMIAILIVALAPAAAARAATAADQDPRGALTGRVTDPSGAAVVDAEVRATNVATGVAASGKTSGAGVFSIPFLSAGTYSVTVELPGFRKFVRENIQIRVSETVEVSVPMEVGGVVETLEVRQETPVLETAGASLGHVIDERRVQELPIVAGNPLELALLAPGVVEGTRFIWKPAFSFHQVTIEGNGALNNEFQIDGVANTFAEVDNGRSRYAFAPPASAVREFKVQTAAYDASIGHTIGGFINVSTAGGTNQLRGEAHWFMRNSDLSARDYFAKKAGTTPPDFDDNRYGGSAGGPLVLPRVYNGRNKTFWFYTWEANKWGLPLTFTGTVPTAAQRQGDFSQLLALGSQYQIYDPRTTTVAPGGRLTRTAILNNIIPPERLDPVGLRLVNLYALPNQPGTADGRNNYFKALMAQEDYYVHFGRVDHAFSGNHRVFVRAHYDFWEEDKNRHFDNDVNGLILNRINRGVALDDVYVKGPLVFNLRYGFTQQEFPERRTSRGTNLATLGFSPALVSLVDPALATIPRIRAGGYSPISPWETGDGTTESLTHTFVGGFNTLRGRHNLKAGADFRIYRALGNRFPQSVSPDLNFTSTYTRGPFDNSTAAPIGQELASMLLGVPDGVMVRSASFIIKDRYLGAYIHDDFQITSRLTVNMGLRYELEQPLTERDDRLVAGFAFDTPNPIEAAARANYALNPIPEIPVEAFRVLGGLTWVGQDGLGRSPFRGETNNFMPRLGLAYQPTETTVLRAGYGVYYDTIGVNTTRALQTGFSQSTPIQASLDNGLTYVATLANPFPQGLLPPRGPAGGLTTNLGQNLEFYSRDRKHPYSQRWSVSVQQALPGQILAEATYVGNHGSRLPAVRNINATPLQYLSTLPVRDQARINSLTTQIPNPFRGLDPIYGATISRANLLRPYPEFGNITVEESIGASQYHSVQFRGERRFSRGYTFQATYTWSQLMEAVEFLNAADPMPTEVIGVFDRPHRVTLSGIWEIPVGRGRRFGAGLPNALDAIVGGWQLGGVVVQQAGPPLNFGNILFTGNLDDIALSGDDRSDTKWFNTDAGFNRNSAQQLDWNVRTFPLRIGEARADGRVTWDLSAIKNFRLWREAVLQVRAEVYNLWNRANFREPNTSPTSSDFGVTTRLGTDPRNAQFSLKLKF
jgi:hypothetical protein